ncbi:MAG: hypothetical protein HFJ17_00360 [Clostridia bacterium]|nr:hypothetical protein [Clostridia bacterium]
MRNEIKDKLKNKGGITLIALVITIIVLLILAGIAISMLAGDNGILKQAAKAKEDTSQSSTEEQIKLAVMAAINTERRVDTKVLVEELKKIDNKDRTITKLPCIVEVNGMKHVIESDGNVQELVTIDNLKKSKKPVSRNTIILFGEGDNQEQIIIPAGFRIAEDSAEDIKDGIVVQAPDGTEGAFNSEFVWVPVKDARKMYETKKVTQVDGTKKEIKVGKLYNDGDINRSITWSDTGYREPVILKDSTNGDASTGGLNLLNTKVGISGTVGENDDKMLSMWETQLQDEFNEMIKSVEKNKGFYVARYEISLRDEKGEKVIQSKKGETSATAEANSCNTWYGLYQKNKEYSIKNEKLKNVVESNMIWGSQYDQMMIWMTENEKDLATKGKEKGNTGRKTGTVETDKINNVYDLYGNSYEWTLESTLTFRRTIRRWLFLKCSCSDKSIWIWSMHYR